MNIYESAEDYLEQILMLLESKGYARSVDIAHALKVKKPSVSVAMKKLRENGYISMERTCHRRFRPWHLWSCPALSRFVQAAFSHGVKSFDTR